MLTEKELVRMILEGENALVDFKLEHHKCPVELVHDVLCFSNAEGNGDRYCIFGVENKSRKIKGIASEGYCRSGESIIDTLKKCDLNRLPTVKLKRFFLGGVYIDVLTIKNIFDKPYFLQKDYRCPPEKHSEKHKYNEVKKAKKEKGVLLRAGVVYTREGETNTPVDSTASESRMQKMWEERFGLTLTPLERIKIYIENTKGWKHALRVIEDDSERSAFYAEHPEFTIESYDSREPCRDFFEHWHLKESVFAYHELGMKRVTLKYHQTILKTLELINVEYKHFFPVPDYCDPGNVRDNPRAQISRSSLSFKIAAILMTEDDSGDSQIQCYSDALRTFFFMNRNEFALEINE